MLFDHLLRYRQPEPDSPPRPARGKRDGLHPRADLRLRKIPLGPVAVFGARATFRWPSPSPAVTPRPLWPPALRLLSDEAPLACRNFARLAESGFFDGIAVHRLVPNFVVQDGDPRGDGLGGPGYAIRDELGPRRFLAGTVGMATDGPDSAGSQWFVTLSAQPHLDGRYTAFAIVTQNFEGVASRMLPGDRIVRVEVYEGDGSEALLPAP